jgi:uncharacterized protein (TIGR00725 family)
MSRARQVSVVGAGTCDDEIAAKAEAVGRGLAEAGLVLVCGAMSGVMEAAAKGAAEAGGTVIGVGPGDDVDSANAYCTHVIATGLGHARNLAVVASGEVVIAVGGEWGTLSEIGFARKLGRRVIALGSWKVDGAGEMADGPGITAVEDPDAAVAAALKELGVESS